MESFEEDDPSAFDCEGCCTFCAACVRNALSLMGLTVPSRVLIWVLSTISWVSGWDPENDWNEGYENIERKRNRK